MNTELIEQNVHRLLGAMTGAATTAMVAVGDQLGLYRALADGGPATQDELAARTGTAAPYLREWLSQQAAAGFLAYVVVRSVEGLGGWTGRDLVSLYVMLGIGIAIMIYVRFRGGSDYFKLPRETYQPDAEPAVAASGDAKTS